MKHQPLYYLALGICLGALLGVATTGYAHTGDLTLILVVAAAATSMMSMVAAYLHAAWAHRQLVAAQQVYERVLETTKRLPHDHE